jgi:protein TonB
VPLALPLHPLEPSAPPPQARPFAPASAPPASVAPSAQAPQAATALERPLPGEEDLALAAPAPAAVPPPALHAGGRTSEPIRISGEKPRYPELARPLRQRGSVIVELRVARDGVPHDLRVVESAGVLLDDAALAALRTWRYQPAEEDGVTVDSLVRVRLEFEPPQ